MTEETEPTKVIEYYAVVDWKQEEVTARKTRPKSTELGKNELLAKLQFNVYVPEDPDVPTLSADLDIPEPQVRAATLDALDRRDMPDWTEDADEILADNEEFIRTSYPERNLVDPLAIEVLERTNSRPKVENVVDYIEEQVEYLVNDSNE